MLGCILNIKDINNVPYKQWRMQGMEVYQDANYTVRKNLDETEFIITFLDNNIPSIVGENKIYTREELTNYINDPANGWEEQE